MRLSACGCGGRACMARGWDRGCSRRPIAPDLRPCRYITMNGVDKSRLLNVAADTLRRRGWDPIADAGWSSWDLDVPCPPGSRLQVRTVQEFYEGNSAQIGIEYRLSSE